MKLLLCLSLFSPAYKIKAEQMRCPSGEDRFGLLQDAVVLVVDRRIRSAMLPGGGKRNWILASSRNAAENVGTVRTILFVEVDGSRCSKRAEKAEQPWKATRQHAVVIIPRLCSALAPRHSVPYVGQPIWGHGLLLNAPQSSQSKYCSPKFFFLESILTTERLPHPCSTLSAES